MPRRVERRCCLCGLYNDLHSESNGYFSSDQASCWSGTIGNQTVVHKCREASCPGSTQRGPSRARSAHHEAGGGRAWGVPVDPPGQLAGWGARGEGLAPSPIGRSNGDPADFRLFGERRPGGGVDHVAHGLALEIDAVGVVDQAVEDRVGVGGVADHVVPALDR